MTRPCRTWLAAVAVLAATASMNPPLAAQVPDSLPVDSVRPIPRVPPAPARADTGAPVTPRGAMIRSMILPGWGQAQFDAYFRGGIYFAGWAGNWFMNFRNAYRLDNARTLLEVRTEQVEDQLIAASSNPDSLRAQIDSFPSILQSAVSEDSLGSRMQRLVRSREQQREDWIAWSMFWVLASGIDAYVTAHLADFPADVELRPSAGRAVSLSVSLPFDVRGAPRRSGGAVRARPPPRDQGRPRPR